MPNKKTTTASDAISQAAKILRQKDAETKKNELDSVGFIFETALMPNAKGKLNLGHPETIKEETKRRKMEL